MVLTHYTCREGCLVSMKEFCLSESGGPNVTTENTVLFGFQPEEMKLEHWTYLVENRFKCYTCPTVRKDPKGKAEEALKWLGSKVERFLLHFDVDTIDSGRFPIGNFPHYTGMMFEEVMEYGSF